MVDGGEEEDLEDITDFIYDRHMPRSVPNNVLNHKGNCGRADFMSSSDFDYILQCYFFFFFSLIINTICTYHLFSAH